MGSGLRQFLNTVYEDGGIPIVDPNDPINTSKLALTLAFSVFATLSIGIQRVLQAIYNGISAILTGVTEFFAGSGAITLGQATELELAKSLGIIGFIGQDSARFIAAVWESSLGSVPGILQLPVGLAVVLLTYWIVAQGIDYAREEVF